MFDKKKFFTPLFSTCFWIRDPGWVKIRIRDKHPGSATLPLSKKPLYQYFIKIKNRLKI
jgi:hypothetical protein